MNRDTATLKTIGLISMLLDHTGAVLFPDILIFRVIGRLAFPLFAYSTVIGFQHTHSLKRYISRLVLCGFITQPVYIFSFLPDTLRLNILFTLALGLAALWALHKKRRLLLVLFLGLSQFLQVEYGPLGILLMLVFYQSHKKRRLCLLFSVILFFCLSIPFGTIQLFMLLALPLIFCHKARITLPRLDRRIFYYCYPVHLAILSLFRLGLS